MAGWTTTLTSAVDFVADPNSVDRNTGRQIDWDNVEDVINEIKTVKAGTVMVELASGKICPRATRPGTETAIGLLIGTAIENLKSHALSGYGIYIGGVFYENLLPEGVPAAAVKTELAAAGTGFAWETYADSSEV